jgi:hypothetical protein
MYALSQATAFLINVFTLMENQFLFNKVSHNTQLKKSLHKEQNAYIALHAVKFIWAVIVYYLIYLTYKK